jgi:lysophospholipase L1-like esterase
MATRNDASMFILDFIPNVNVTQLTERTNTFFSIIRKANPKTPILFVETVIFTHSLYDKYINETIVEKNRLLKAEYEKIKKEGDKNVYYLTSNDLIGHDGESTVDGIHLTDVGFLRISEALFKKIKRIE